MERMDAYRTARRLLMPKLSGVRVRGRPRLGWIDGVKVALGSRRITSEVAQKNEGVESPGASVDD